MQEQLKFLLTLVREMDKPSGLGFRDTALLEVWRCFRKVVLAFSVVDANQLPS